VAIEYYDGSSLREVKKITVDYDGAVRVIRRVTLDGVQIWPSWAFFDDFERSTIGANWQGSGALIELGRLKKNTTNGSADYWTSQQFAGDDLYVRTVLGPIQDAQQRASIILGSPSTYVFVEFSKTGGIIGDYDGWTWTTRATIPSLALATGDVIEVSRVGTTVTLKHNGATVATATSTQGRGVGNRRVGLSVRRDSNFFGTFYGPTFDEVGVRVQ
jgi:hypothetical protein